MDDQSAIHLVKNPEFHNRTKHIDIRYKFIREQYENKQLNVINCCSEVQAADILTKPLAKDRFLKLRIVDTISYAGVGYRDKASFREKTLESTDIPKWDDFLACLNKRCLFLENLPSVGTKADPTFNISNSIDALLSADIFFDILKDGKYKLDNGNLILQNTEFGCIISGNTSRFSSGSLHCGLITKDFETLNDTLK
ncbi:retrovirus-related Pol polyprotein from transposon TNT 1-94 [Trichonephila clavata]|uniref:Retrovirus-related Pol polyprotein from transposon TNT 1-94 n=1 Tax=Trichonephila clavata TaxID=2740835 RepID=A0A8X6J570_TRICU|nr:retrovirus-related Pol polyprotein from transposon TNT 1-94 [Trichonephila clavata]